MKKTFTNLIIMVSILAFTQYSLYSQDAQSLVKIHNVSSVANMNSINLPTTGSLVYVTAESIMYQYDGSSWQSTQSDDGDAWNVNGEDLNSSISRTGDVGIGVFPTQTLDVNGSLRVRDDLVVNGVLTNDSVAFYDVFPYNEETSALNQTYNIDFSQSNLARTSGNPQNTYVLNNLKNGGTYSLIIQGIPLDFINFTLYSGTPDGIATFESPGYTFRGDSHLTKNNFHTLYTFLVMGTNVYFFQINDLQF